MNWASAASALASVWRNTIASLPISDGSVCARIGHADVAFTMKQYAQTDLEAGREVANTLADLILGGLLVTDEIDDQADDLGWADRRSSR